MMTSESAKSMMYIILLLTIYMFSKTHIMNNLIIIEMTTITIMMIMFKIIYMTKLENFMILYFIIIVICESMVGLSLMIAMIRTHSNDYMKSLNMLKF